MSTYSGFSSRKPRYRNWSTRAAEPQKDRPIAFSLETTNPQRDCPLFSRIPPEIRSLIFEYALKDYEDKTKIYEDDTCYKRPGCLAPRRTDTELLRTCKRIYTEAWYLPWASAEHSFYLAWPTRSPPGVMTPEKMQRALNTLCASHAERSIEHVRVFAQLCHLEGGERLTKIMDMKYFNPKIVTITIRHTDWWEWETDRPLHFGMEWVNVCRFPESMKELRVAFESLERKKASVDQVAEQAIKKWEFERKDGVIMSAEGCVPSIIRWSGGSTWEGKRWLRDETRPNQLDYYVATVTWRPVVEDLASILPAGVADLQAPERRKRKAAKPLDAEVEAMLITGMDSVLVIVLEEAEVPKGAAADEVQRLVSKFQDNLRSRWDYENDSDMYEDDHDDGFGFDENINWDSEGVDGYSNWDSEGVDEDSIIEARHNDWGFES